MHVTTLFCYKKTEKQLIKVLAVCTDLKTRSAATKSYDSQLTHQGQSHDSQLSQHGELFASNLTHCEESHDTHLTYHEKLSDSHLTESHDSHLADHGESHDSHLTDSEESHDSHLTDSGEPHDSQMKEFQENQLTKLLGRDLQSPFHVTIQLTVDDTHATQQKLVALLEHLQGINLSWSHSQFPLMAGNETI